MDPSHKYKVGASTSVKSQERKRMPKELMIIGSGPSSRLFYSRKNDLRLDIDTFGLGFQLRFFGDLDFYPDYWALTDRKVVGAQWAEIRALLEKSPAAMNAYLPLQAKQRISRPVTWVPHQSTGTFALKESRELGYKTGYLIGLEGSYQERIPEAAEVGLARRRLLHDAVKVGENETLYEINEQPKFNPNYFSDNYQQVGDIYSKPLADRHKTSLQSVVDLLTSEGVEVVNLSPISLIQATEAPIRDIFRGPALFGGKVGPSSSQPDQRVTGHTEGEAEKIWTSSRRYDIWSKSKDFLRLKFPAAYKFLRWLKGTVR